MIYGQLPLVVRQKLDIAEGKKKRHIHIVYINTRKEGESYGISFFFNTEKEKIPEDELRYTTSKYKY